MGGEDGKEMIPELSISLDILVLQSGLQKTISHLIQSKVVISFLQQHLVCLFSRLNHM